MEFIGPVISLLIFAGMIVGLVAIIRRVGGRASGREAEGNDILAYLLLALAVGTAGFSLSALVQAAFPGESIFFDPRGQVAGSLAALVVSGPIAVFLWRRQERRRADYPDSVGWTVFLALMEAVFLTSLVVAAVSVLGSLMGGPDGPAWSDLVVFGGIVVFHEFAARRTPPGSGISELPRVVGSAVGLIAMATGLGGLLTWAFENAFGIDPGFGGLEAGSSAATIVVGAAIWWFRWLRPWDLPLQAPRSFWTSLMSISGLVTAAGSAAVIAGQSLIFLVFDTAPAGSHFGFLPETLATGIVSLLVWGHHRRRLGDERNDSLRAYQYASAAAGLGAAVGSAATLASIAFGPSGLVGRPSNASVSVGLVLIAGLLLWWRFWSLCSSAPRIEEAASAPRRFYLLGMGVVTGLVSAGALIATLVVVFQALLGNGAGDNFALQGALFVFSGLAAWHLLRINANDRALIASVEEVTPFDVTIVCSDPGPLDQVLPKVASLRVIRRGDDAGVVDQDMAAAIVETVANADSIVWVDEDGFRVAPAR